MKLAVVTGAAQGIGRRTAEILRRRRLFSCPVGSAIVRSTLAAVCATGCEAADFPGDLSDESVVDITAAAIRARWDRVDVLVNNAGISSIARRKRLMHGPFAGCSKSTWSHRFLLARAFGKMMLQQRSGSIVNVASIAGLAGIADRAAYNASKHGLIGLTRTLLRSGEGAACAAMLFAPGGSRRKWMSPTRQAVLTRMRTFSE